MVWKTVAGGVNDGKGCARTVNRSSCPSRLGQPLRELGSGTEMRKGEVPRRTRKGSYGVTGDKREGGFLLLWKSLAFVAGLGGDTRLACRG